MTIQKKMSVLFSCGDPFIGVFIFLWPLAFLEERSSRLGEKLKKVEKKQYYIYAAKNRKGDYLCVLLTQEKD